MQQAVAQLEKVGVVAEFATTDRFNYSDNYCKFGNSSTARNTYELESNLEVFPPRCQHRMGQIESTATESSSGGVL